MGSEDAAAAPARRRAVNVRVGGKDYRIVSSADAQWLQGVATGVDDAMALVRDKTETVDSMDVAVLTALNLARELVLLREQVAAEREARQPVGDAVVDAARVDAIIDLAESALGGESAV